MAHNALECRPTFRISDWTSNVYRTIAELNPAVTVGRVHFMLIQIAACGCSAALLHPVSVVRGYRIGEQDVVLYRTSPDIVNDEWPLGTSQPPI
jgi:hypothetical protein